MQFIGTKIELNGWKEYRGGLDVSVNEASGKHAYFTNWNDHSIMFHTAPLIPYKVGDPSRKRHVGNDVIVIIFKEGNEKINPIVFKSQFNHVFIVVSKMNYFLSEETFYKIEVMTKPTVPTFAPFLPDPPIFAKNDKFREYLLSKIINGEQSTLSTAKSFKTNLKKVRRELLVDLVNKAEKGQAPRKEGNPKLTTKTSKKGMKGSKKSKKTN